MIMPLRHDPVALMLSRQAAADPRPHEVRPGERRSPGARTSWPTPPDGTPDVILIATGSEVALAVERLRAAHRRRASSARVVSMPSMELFDQQPPGLPRRGPAARGDRPGRGRAGHPVRLGPLGRPDRRHHRHEHLRRVRARSRRCRPSSGSPPRTSSRRPGPSSDWTTPPRGHHTRIVGLMNRNLARGPQRCHRGRPGWPSPPGRRSPPRHCARSVFTTARYAYLRTHQALSSTPKPPSSPARVTPLPHQPRRSPPRSAP